MAHLHPLARTERALARFFVLLAIALILASFFAGRAHAQTLTFTPELARGSESVVPKLSWATTPAATSCTASGDAAWTGTKAASGTVTLAAINSTKTYSLVCTWPGETDVDFRWIVPTAYTNAAPLTVAKYTITFGTNATDVGLDPRTPNPNPVTTKTVTIPAPATAHHVTNVGSPGLYHFCLRAWDAASLASDCTRDEAGKLPVKTITASTTQTRAVTVTVDPKPSAPTGFVVE